MEAVKSNKVTGYDTTSGGDVRITLFTDPLCCWSWAFAPELAKLQAQMQHRLHITYRMGGLLPSWKHYYDEANAVSRPMQMGPVWMHAGLIANRPIHHQLWIQDPPASSYPACIAFKCVQLQGEALAEKYLHLLWQRCMGNGKNIAHNSELQQAAETLAAGEALFNLEQFKEDMVNNKGLEAFRTDLEKVSYYKINRFPALIIQSNNKAIMLTGYRPHSQVSEAISRLQEQ